MGERCCVPCLRQHLPHSCRFTCCFFPSCEHFSTDLPDSAGAVSPSKLTRRGSQASISSLDSGHHHAHHPNASSSSVLVPGTRHRADVCLLVLCVVSPDSAWGCFRNIVCLGCVSSRPFICSPRGHLPLVPWHSSPVLDASYRALVLVVALVSASHLQLWMSANHFSKNVENELVSPFVHKLMSSHVSLWVQL